MSKRRVLFWAPRALSIGYILLLSLFSLDVYAGSLTLQEILIGFIMHNIPVFILIGMLVISWKQDRTGAILWGFVGFLALGLLFFNVHIREFTIYHVTWLLTIPAPMFLISFLYYRNWKQKQI